MEIISIYAPNLPAARAKFWNTLEHAIPSIVEHWIMGDDFNMLEDTMNRNGGSSATVHGRELVAWEKLLFKMQVMDEWQDGNFCKTPGTLNVSRSSGGADMYRTENANSTNSIVNMSRIDIFYVSDFFREHGGQ